jgi:DNA-binding transcriptional ArsR family regulator
MGAHGAGARGPAHLRSGAHLTDAAAKLQALDEVIAALAHPARRQILLTIHFLGGATSGEIARRFAHAWPTTTRHLRLLETAGLLTQEKVGRERRYTVNDARLDLVSEWLGWFRKDSARR